MFAGTTTFPLAGIGNAPAFPLNKLTVTPPAGAAPLIVTVPVVVCPETTLAGLKDNIVTTGCGTTVRFAVMGKVSGGVTVMVTLVLVATANVVTLKVPLVAPAAMVKLAGTVAAPVLLLIRVIVNPPVGAAPFRFTVPTEPTPPVTDPGLNINDAMEAGSTVSVPAILKLVPELADTITIVGVATPDVFAVNVCVLLPAGTVMPAGTVTDGSELSSETNTPPAGATKLIVTVPVDEFPPATVDGLKLTCTTGGGNTVSITVADPVPPDEAVAVTVTVVAVFTAPATTGKV